MAKQIHILPLQVANQIAAGEVVERPASIIKELIENSIDAGARRIQVDIEQGGLRLIRVRDDGGGIGETDLPLTISRFATSKIHSIKDLQSLDSLGFRGEALASIASVSRMTISSCEQQAALAWQIQVSSSDEKPKLEPVSHPVGTTVEVRDLFFNTPARRNFLRSDKTEFSHIEEVFKRMAISHGEVGFTLRHNQRLVHQCRPAIDIEQREQRIASLLSATFMQHALHIDFVAASFRLTGWIALPEYARSQTDQQYFYINGRFIRDRLIMHAVRQAYQDVLYEGRHPSYVLFLECEPNRVDVNVHPTKHEVRFRDSRTVHDFIAEHVRQALNSEESESAQRVELAMSEPAPQRVELAMSEQAVAKQFSMPQRETVQVAETLAYYQTATSEEPPPPSANALTVIKEKFLIAEKDDGLLLVDIENAYAQVIHQQFSLHLEQAKPIKSQALLMPLAISCEAKLIDALEVHKALLTQLGFDFDRSGEESMMLRQLPELLSGCDVEQLFLSLADFLKNNKNKPSLIHGIILQLAQDYAKWHNKNCHVIMGELLTKLFAVDIEALPKKLDKAYRRLTSDELAALL